MSLTQGGRNICYSVHTKGEGGGVCEQIFRLEGLYSLIEYVFGGHVLCMLCAYIGVPRFFVLRPTEVDSLLPLLLLTLFVSLYTSALSTLRLEQSRSLALFAILSSPFILYLTQAVLTFITSSLAATISISLLSPSLTS
ncbi:hypothetical protein B0F90DRAFT_1324970 [Multifurca ochricompacta]|uniref:Uncharacterized protein n=1 Tax=Multifurca ochricompacta TaxID=376703 RepID=A0AAD4M757_9AGAM|nr:hypothetical protein B0F90DRAFT_1324970 [Multifurca ochricompacta]